MSETRFKLEKHPEKEGNYRLFLYSSREWVPFCDFTDEQLDDISSKHNALRTDGKIYNLSCMA